MKQRKDTRRAAHSNDVKGMPAAENLSLETNQLSFGAQSDKQLLQRQNVSNDTFFGCLETTDFRHGISSESHPVLLASISDFPHLI